MKIKMPAFFVEKNIFPVFSLVIQGRSRRGAEGAQPPKLFPTIIFITIVLMSMWKKINNWNTEINCVKSLRICYSWHHFRQCRSLEVEKFSAPWAQLWWATKTKTKPPQLHYHCYGPVIRYLFPTHSLKSYEKFCQTELEKQI